MPVVREVELEVEALTVVLILAVEELIRVLVAVAERFSGEGVGIATSSAAS